MIRAGTTGRHGEFLGAGLGGSTTGDRSGKTSGWVNGEIASTTGGAGGAETVCTAPDALRCASR